MQLKKEELAAAERTFSSWHTDNYRTDYLK